MSNMETTSNSSRPSNNEVGKGREIDVSEFDTEPRTKRLKPNNETYEERKGAETMRTESKVNNSRLVIDSSCCLYVSNISSSTLPEHSTLVGTDEVVVQPWVSHCDHDCHNVNVNNQSSEKNDTAAHLTVVANVTSDSSTQQQKDNVVFPVADVKSDNFRMKLSNDMLNKHSAEHNKLNILSLRQENIVEEMLYCHNTSNFLEKENSQKDEKQKSEKCETEHMNENYVVKDTSPTFCLQETGVVNQTCQDSQSAVGPREVLDNDVDKITTSHTTTNSVDVYDITECDENSQPLTPLHKVKIVSQNKKELSKSEEKSTVNTVKASRDLQAHLHMKNRVAYMYSYAYVRVCDEMLRVAGRASMVHSLIEGYDLLKYMDVVPPRETTPDELLQFHTSDYIHFLKKISEQEDEEKYDEEAEQYGLTYDCPVHIGVYDYAVLVTGATICAAELLVSGSCDVAINWGGGWHHAKRDTASGFCYFNDIALGILKLREKFERVLYVDLDLHHGDGVEDAFCTTSKVLTVSFHKYLAGFFPGTGSLSDIGVSKGRHYTINVPLLDGIKDAEFYALFNRVISKVRERFKPEAIVCQCGADGVAGDPMESFNLTPLSLGRCVHTLHNWKIPLLLLGGGGYNFVNTAKCWAFITSVIVGRKLPDDIPDHKFFMEYGPDYELSVFVGNRKDNNTREYLGKVYRQVMENLSYVT